LRGFRDYDKPSTLWKLKPFAPTQEAAMQKRDKEKSDEDEDSYIRDLASVWGHCDLVQAWLPHHHHEPAKITDYVLFPSVMYGQLGVMRLALPCCEFLDHESGGVAP
jgi:hypothetical protein